MDDTFVLSRRGLLRAALSVTAVARTSALWAADERLPPFGLPGSVGKVSPFLKRNGFMKRRPGMSNDAFVDHWLNVHAKLLAKIPGLDRCVLNVVDKLHSPDSPYDGITEFFFHSEAAHEASYATPEDELHRALAADSKLFLAEEFMRLFTHEIVIRDFAGKPPGGAVKRIGLVKHRPELTHEAFIKDWRDVHAPEANAMVGVIRYTLNAVDPRLSPEAPWSGYAELWWKDRAAYEAASRQRLAERAALEKRGIMGPTLPALLMMVEPHQIL